MTALVRMNAILVFLGTMPVLALVPQFWTISRNQSPSPTKTPPAAPSKADDLESGTSIGQVTRADPAAQNGQTGLASPDQREVDDPQARELHERLPVRRFPPAEVQLDADRFEQLQARLQAQGVDYYVLERQAGAKPGYRFHCRIRVDGSSTYVRPFDAQDEDPLVAMELVLRELEQWNARREARSNLR